jgi:hypothetical protein
MLLRGNSSEGIGRDDAAWEAICRSQADIEFALAGRQPCGALAGPREGFSANVDTIGGTTHQPNLVLFNATIGAARESSGRRQIAAGASEVTKRASDVKKATPGAASTMRDRRAPAH